MELDIVTFFFPLDMKEGRPVVEDGAASIGLMNASRGDLMLPPCPADLVFDAPMLIGGLGSYIIGGLAYFIIVALGC